MSDKRRAIYSHFQSRINVLIAQSLADGMDHPVVVICDCDDDFGRLLAEARAGKADVAKHLAESRSRQESPCLLFSLNRQDAIDDLSSLSSKANATLSAAMRPGVHICAVISGGVSWVQHKLPEDLASAN